MPKFTKKAQFTIIGFMFLFIITLGFILSLGNNDNTEGKNITITVVKENSVLKSSYVDSISQQQSSDKYVPCKISISKDDMIGEYKILKNQSFTKYIQLLGPDSKIKLSDDSDEIVTHYVYVCLLTGDIIEKDTDGEKTYEIVNARVTYNKVPVVLSAKDNTISVKNSNDKVSTYKIQEFINKLENIEERKEIIK